MKTRAADPCVYALQHDASGKRYIGSTRSLEHRWSKHRSELLRGCHKNAALQELVNKDGIGSLEVVVLERVDEVTLYDAEQRWLDLLWSSGTLLNESNVADTRKLQRKKKASIPVPPLDVETWRKVLAQSQGKK